MADARIDLFRMGEHDYLMAGCQRSLIRVFTRSRDPWDEATYRTALAAVVQRHITRHCGPGHCALSALEVTHA